jgi:hypothetical protein
MKLYEIMLLGHINSYYAYGDTIITTIIKANHASEACQRATTEFIGIMVNIQVIKCKEIEV